MAIEFSVHVLCPCVCDCGMSVDIGTRERICSMCTYLRRQELEESHRPDPWP